MRKRANNNNKKEIRSLSISLTISVAIEKKKNFIIQQESFCAWIIAILENRTEKEKKG
jgi:hypothetical protein